jgi:hypothetical protein
MADERVEGVEEEVNERKSGRTKEWTNERVDERKSGRTKEGEPKGGQER